jgi:hypothetical protein
VEGAGGGACRGLTEGGLGRNHGVDGEAPAEEGGGWQKAMHGVGGAARVVGEQHITDVEVVEEGAAPELTGDAQATGRRLVAQRYVSSRTCHGTTMLEAKSRTRSSKETWAPATALGAIALASIA